MQSATDNAKIGTVVLAFAINGLTTAYVVVIIIWLLCLCIRPIPWLGLTPTMCQDIHTISTWILIVVVTVMRFLP